jgi:hypothetical protein
MPLLSTFHQDTLDVPDIDEDRSWCQQKRSHAAFENRLLQKSNRIGSVPSLQNFQNRFVQDNNNEDMSVMTIDSTMQNINTQSTLHDDNSVSDMEGSIRRISIGNNQPIPIEAPEINREKASRNPSLSSSSWIPSKNADSSCDDERRKGQQGKKNKQRRKFSTQTYSQGGMVYSSLHESMGMLDDSSRSGTGSSRRGNGKGSIFESNKARGSAKLLISGTPSTQASSQASMSPRDLTISGLVPSLSNPSDQENYHPSVSSEPYEPEQEIVKLSIELATSKQDLDHANLQAKQYKNEMIKLRDLLEEIQEENTRLKYKVVDMEKNQMSEIISSHHGHKDNYHTEFPLAESTFHTPMKPKPLDVTQETADDSIDSQFVKKSYHEPEGGLFDSKGDMITPIKSPARLDQSHITCQSLYDDTPNIETDFEEETILVNESINTQRENSPPRMLFTTNDTASPQDEIFQGDPFATCERRGSKFHEMNTRVDVGEDTARKYRWPLQWNSNKSAKVSTDSRQTRFFFFGTSTIVDNNGLGEIGSVSGSVSSSSSSSQLENKKVFGFGFSF